MHLSPNKLCAVLKMAFFSFAPWREQIVVVPVNRYCNTTDCFVCNIPLLTTLFPRERERGSNSWSWQQRLSRFVDCGWIKLY